VLVVPWECKSYCFFFFFFFFVLSLSLSLSGDVTVAVVRYGMPFGAQMYGMQQGRFPGYPQQPAYGEFLASFVLSSYAWSATRRLSTLRTQPSKAHRMVVLPSFRFLS
jgi:hypothetical protein